MRPCHRKCIIVFIGELFLCGQSKGAKRGRVAGSGDGRLLRRIDIQIGTEAARDRVALVRNGDLDGEWLVNLGWIDTQGQLGRQIGASGHTGGVAPGAYVQQQYHTAEETNKPKAHHDCRGHRTPLCENKIVGSGNTALSRDKAA